jgi:hypothetical protein
MLKQIFSCHERCGYHEFMHSLHITLVVEFLDETIQFDDVHYFRILMVKACYNGL